MKRIRDARGDAGFSVRLAREPGRNRPDETAGNDKDASQRASYRAADRAVRAPRARNPSSSDKSGNCCPASGSPATASRGRPPAGRSSRRHSNESFQKPPRFADRCGDIGATHALTDPKDDVESLDRGPAGANRFTQPAAQAIAIHGTRHGLASDDIADTAGIPLSRCGDQLQEVRVAADAKLEQRLECARARQSEASATSACGWRNGRQTVRRARPLARRAARTLRPPTVFIRARNPCVRARLTFEG